MPESIPHIETLLNQGKYFEARTKAEDALKYSDEMRLKQLFALSTSKSGSPEAALTFMEPVYKQFPNDPESAGILGSIYKELFKKNQSTPFAIKSRDTYFQNFSITKDYYTGINAASMSAMAGQAGRSREIAAQIISLLENSGTDDFWKVATLAEASMLIKNRTRAIEYFIRARQLAGNDWGKITSVHNQLWLLNHFIPVPAEILKIFSPPTVVAFIGHMIDHPHRTTPRFPASIEQQVKDAIMGSIQTLNARIGYCSLACGGDILFAEAMVEAGGEVNIFLPFAEKDFIEQSIRFAGEHWIDRYHQLIKKFPPTLITQEPYAGFDDLFVFQNRIISGLATLRSATNHAEPTLLTILSEVDLKRKKGGTRDTIHHWPFAQRHININPDIFRKEQTALATPGQPAPERKETSGSIERPVLYVCHISTKNLATLDYETLQKTVASKISESHIAVKSYEVREDFILAAFEIGPELMEFVNLLAPFTKPSNRDSTIRVSLHAGPVFINPESISLNKNLSGDTIDVLLTMSQALATGAVLASDHFTALLALEPKKYLLDYAGLVTVSTRETRAIYRVGLPVR